jgi:hypothetical protein
MAWPVDNVADDIDTISATHINNIVKAVKKWEGAVDANAQALTNAGMITATGATIGTGGIVVRPTGEGTKFRVNAAWLAIGASATIESLADGGTSGLLWIYATTATHFGIVAVRAGYNAVTIVSDPLSGLAATDTASKLCVFPDGDGTYTLKNNTGAAIILMVQFLGF